MPRSLVIVVLTLAVFGVAARDGGAPAGVAGVSGVVAARVGPASRGAEREGGAGAAGVGAGAGTRAAAPAGRSGSRVVEADAPVDAVTDGLAGGADAADAATDAVAAAAASSRRLDLVLVPGGSYVPLYTRDGGAVRVEAFELGRYPVTRADYLEFVRADADWRRSRVPRVFAEAGYLRDWEGDLDFGDPADADRPVVDVSWFAANAYCAWRGGRLPTVDEWEFVARASEDRRDASDDPAFRQRLIGFYTRPASRPLPAVGTAFRNAYGIHDLHGSVREWVLDFDGVLTSDDSRGAGARDDRLYCAAATTGASDRGDYAAFLRHAFRASVDGRATIGNLGFRCARSVDR